MASLPVLLALKVNWPGCWKRLLISIFRYLAVVADVDAVAAQQEVDVVGQRVVGPAEKCLRVVADGEETRHL